MSDLIFRRSGEFGVTQIEGSSGGGCEFVDSLLLPGMIVDPSGSVIVRSDVADEIEVDAVDHGLSVHHETAL